MLGKWKEYRTIKKSILFDPAYYLLNNPDVRDADIDPLLHFIDYGWKEGRNPSQKFNTRYYLETNPDVKLSGVNPLVHYLQHGQKEGREITPDAKKAVKVLSSDTDGIPANTQNLISEKRKQISDVIDLLYLEPHIPSISLEKPIDILIPVYDGGDFLDLLLAGIVRNTFIPYRLLILYDANRAPSAPFVLEEFKNKNPGVDLTLIENEDGSGFVKTVNKLVALAQNHFVILYADAEVPPHWLERLIHPILTGEDVASAVPFTNGAGFYGFQDLFQENPAFKNMDTAALDLFFQYVNFEKNYAVVPPAGGFCMAVNKGLYDKIGIFDESFGEGPAAENDWCLRAVQAGCRNILVPNLFVARRPAEILSNVEQEQLVARNSELLGNKHPEYFPLAADFIQRDPFKYLRTVLKIKVLSSLHQLKIALNDSSGGEADVYSKKMLSKESLSAFIVPGNTMSEGYHIEFCGQEMAEISFDMGNSRDLERVIRHFTVDEIIIHGLVGYPKPKILDLVDFLSGLKKNNDRLVLTCVVHDYFSVCPIRDLLDHEIKYCGVPSDLNYCNKCLAINPLMKFAVPYVQADYPNLTIALWRQKFGDLLACSSGIICFSQNSIEILQKAYPDLPSDKFEIASHPVDQLRPVVIHKTSEMINVAILDHITIKNGAQMISQLASYVDYYNLNIRFHIFGNVLEPAESFGLLKPLVRHAEFQTSDLPNLMEDNEIDLVLAPSIYPQTFLYAIEAAMRMHLPVAVFDIGASVERVKFYDMGMVLRQQDPKYMVEAMGEYLNKKISLSFGAKEDVVFVCVSNNDLVYARGVLSFAYMTEHKILKYDNKETNTSIPARYNHAIDELLGTNYRGWVFFVHNDFSILESVDGMLEELDPSHLYGPIGAVLEDGVKRMIGQILQGHNGGLIYHGSRVTGPTLVDTVDCQCLLVHTDLLKKYGLRFDEHEILAFHQYVEDFCINANVNFAIRTYAVPIKCKHVSRGSLNRGFDLAMDYINSKYPDKKWAGTCTHL